MKYLREFNSSQDVNKIKYTKDYYEPYVYDVNKDIQFKQQEDYLVVVVDTSLLDNNVDTLWTTFNGDIFNEILVDNVVWNDPLTPPKKPDLEVGKHILKIKFKDNTKIGYNSPLFYNKHVINVFIPDNFNVVCLNTFLNCTSLKSIKLPESINIIETSAFGSCTSLTKVIMPKHKLTTLGSNNFNRVEEIYINVDNISSIISILGGGNIKKITIGPDVTSLSVGALSGLSNLKTVKILSNKIKEIPSYMCSGCYSLKSINIPNSVTSIGNSAFGRCSSLESINIPNSVTSIGSYNFDGCLKLGYVEDGIRYIDYPNNLGTDFICIDDNTLENYIFKNAKSVSLPTFSDFTNIKYIDLSKTDITTIYENNFKSCQTIKNIILPNSVTSISANAFLNCKLLESVNIPNSVTSIGNTTFGNCSSLKSINIPNSVTSIGDMAFTNCSSLKSIDIPNSVTSLQNNCFYNCTSLESITLSNSLTTLSNYLFCDCSSLKSIVIPDSITTINNSVFNGCNSLSSITLSNSLTAIGTYCFCNCMSLTSIIIPNNVTTIKVNTFQNCINLSSITLSNNLTTINPRAFINCISLTSIDFPNSLSSIYYNSFIGCESLTQETKSNILSLNSNSIISTNEINILYVKTSDGSKKIDNKLLDTTEGYIPIGIELAPANFFGENEPARWLSIQISSNTGFTNSYASSKWGSDGDINNLENKLLGLNISSLSNNLNNNQRKVTDSNGNWNGLIYGNLNEYAITDINGKQNTNLIINNETYQPNWLTDIAVYDYTTLGNHYNAALISSKYYKQGTQQGDWYLGSAGEMVIIMDKFDLLTSKSLLIKTKYDSYMPFGASSGGFLTSTVGSSTDVYCVYFNTSQTTYQTNVQLTKVSRNKEYHILPLLQY